MRSSDWWRRGPGWVLAVPLAAACLAVAAPGQRAAAGEGGLAAAVAGVKVPPPWLAAVPVRYDTRKPWKEARLHIRKLLSEGKRREAIKLTYDYLVVRKANPDDHEYPMYLFLGGEPAWAAKVYLARLRGQPEGHTHQYRSLASLYVHFGEPQKALDVLAVAMQRPPKPPWRIATQAKLHDHMGDVYAHMGHTEKALEHYRAAIATFPRSKQPWGRHLLHREAAKVQAKIDLLGRQSLDLGRIADGTYRGKSLGYAKELHATVVVRGGRIADVRLSHQEKIEQGATTIIPKRIIEKQSLQVDGITGATVTVQAIVDAVYRALHQARKR